MSRNVQRFIVSVFPRDAHPRYYPWQTTKFVLFVGENDRATALKVARAILAQRHWSIIEFQEKITLTGARLREVGGQPWSAYQQAKGGEPFVVEELDQISPACKDQCRHAARSF